MRVMRAQEVGGVEHLLRLARSELPWMAEIFNPGHPHRHGVVREQGILARDDQVARPDEHQASGDAFPLHFGDRRLGNIAPALAHPLIELLRSEEHTSELQSLMRITYAVFCLEKN